MKSLLSFILLNICVLGVSGQRCPSRIEKNEKGWVLLVDDEPFYIKGAVADSYFEKIREYGGNTVRTGPSESQIERACKNQLKALVDLPAAAERDGMDYNDSVAVERQNSQIISIVKKVKDNPAVIMWAIGNELDYIPPLKPFNPKVWDAVNRTAREIHKADPYHPVMTVIGTSMMWKITDIVKRCPDLDLLGINVYGDIFTLSDTLKKYGWNKPYVITEWGPDGYWEVKKTPWGAPFEQSGSQKYDCYFGKYINFISHNKDQCLGSFVFYWSAFKQETTHTWFCMFGENGLESPLPGLMHFLWTGQKLKNEAPLVDSLTIENLKESQPVSVSPGSLQHARVGATDPDGDELTYRWEIRPEADYAAYAGQGEKVPEPLKNLFLSQARDARFNAPSRPGPYRLFVYTYDNNGHFSTANLPFFVSPGLADTTKLGKYTSRTLHLLYGSSAGKKNKVKILVYGQSIAEQKWWLEVKRFVETKYPNASVQMINKSIGGFASRLLYKTTEMDVSSFYPDLVLIHDYGDNRYYDSLLYTIRSRTTAEIAIINDHYTGENRWSDSMSYHILPSLAEKYKCDLINIRDPWKKYLADHDLEPSRLLIDGAHLNEFGNFFMAELIKQLFNYRSGFPDDEFGLCRTYKYGKDLIFTGDTLTLPFCGNRAEVLTEGPGLYATDSLMVLVDGAPPSTFQGCYYITRPYNDTGKKWPWDLPAMIRIQHSKPWINEEWTCRFTKAEPPFNDFNFTISGSVTGDDGNGTGASDFISNSGRVIIRAGDAETGGDWHLSRSFKVVKSVVKPGDEVKWKTYSVSTDYYRTGVNDTATGEKRSVLFQGIPNGAHKLQLVRKGKRSPDISEITVYRPYWGR